MRGAHGGDGSLPLDGLRVLDFSRLLPGPYCSLILADLGADVIKVEDPAGGDPLRGYPPWLDPVGSALFHGLNRNKKSVALDLRSPEGQQAARALAARADVLLESFRPGVMQAFGLSHADLEAQNPRLISCSITGYGQTGPDRDRAGHDLGYAARAGVLGIAGERHGRAEAWPGVQLADVAGGSLWATVAILSALRARDRSGQGQAIDLSMTDGALSLLQLHLSAAWGGGGPLSRGGGPLNGAFPCYGIYRTRDDRQMALAALEPKFWVGFCRAAGRPDLEDRGYDPDARASLEALFAERPFAAWVELSRATDVCLEPVWEGEEVEQDPQLATRGMFYEQADPRLAEGAVRALRLPYRPGPPPERPAPALGAHTRQELEACGLAEEIIEAILARFGGQQA